MKILITGAGGFVGHYLIKELEDNGYEVIPSDLATPGMEVLDITNKESVKSVLEKVKPDYIMHLAGFSSVRDSYDYPEKCLKINLGGTQNLIEAINELALNTGVLIINSSDTYASQPTGKLTEESPESISSPYSKSRIMQKEYVEAHKEINWIISKSFPHIGPGQRLGFVTSDIASQVAKAVNSNAIVNCGDLSAIRDFCNVKDTVRAYRLLMEKGKKHEIYNVCSGVGHSIREVVNEFIKISGHNLKVVENPELIRKTEIPRSVGDNSKITKDLGWKPEISFEETLAEIYHYWEQQILK